MTTHLTRNRLLGLMAAGGVGIGGLAGFSGVHAGSAISTARPAVETQAQTARIDVSMRPWLAQRTSTPSGHSRVAYYTGITPAAIATAAGFQPAEIGSLMAVVNGTQVELTAQLAAGDSLELISGMAGG